MQLPKELKNAISALPATEKNKLIFRLLKKDLTLANRLLFELVSNHTVEDEREKVKGSINRKVTGFNEYWYSPGTFMMDIRYLSGDINEHVAITKDKYGEAWLNLFMLNQVLAMHNERILSTDYNRAEKLCIYLIAKIFKILIAIHKLHEDYFIEFRERLELLGNQINSNAYLTKTALKHGLDIKWLTEGQIPQNIEQIHKDIRAKRLLK